MKKLVYVGFKFSHMGPYAGYDLVKKYAGYNIFVDCQCDYDFHANIISKKNLVSKIYSRLFGGYIFWVELRCLVMALFNSNLVFHFVYAENTYRFLGYFKWLGFNIVCTYHQPASFFNSNPEYLTGVRFIDDVIVLSEGARCIFSGKIDPKHVHFLPHGVDCEYFRPGPARQGKKEILMVGNWLRNFEFAAQVFARILEKDPEINIHVVTLKSNHDIFFKNSRLFLHSGITDQELLRRYQNASLLFLPLNGFVANNAVLEMSAVGANILIASDQNPENNLGNLVEHVPLNIDLAVARIMDLLSNSKPKKEDTRYWVVNNYSWPVIGKRTHRILVNGSV